MDCNLTKLYEYFSSLPIPKPKIDHLNKIDLDPIIAKHSRYIGTAFDGLIKNHLLLIHKEKSYDGPFFRVYSQVEAEKISVKKISCSAPKFDSRWRELKNAKQIYDFNYENLLTRSVPNINERKICADHIKKLIANFKFEHFLPTKKLISNFVPEIHLNNSRKFRVAILELIKDNEIIDIKSDSKLEGIKPEYTAQLFYYYFIIKWLHKYDEIKDSILSHVNPSILSIYYVNFDYLHQFDPSCIFDDEESILDLFETELLEGNNLIQELISLAISSKKSELKRKKLFSKIERRKLQIIQDLTVKHLYCNDGENTRVLMNRFSNKLESYTNIQEDTNEFIEISSNYSHLENSLKLWEMQAPQREFKKIMLGLANNLYPEATYLTMIGSFLPLIEGSMYTYGFSVGESTGLLHLTIKSFELNFMSNYQPLKFKYFKIDDTKYGHYSLDFSLFYFVEDRFTLYSVSGSLWLKEIVEESIIYTSDIPVINKLPLRSLSVPNTIFNIKTSECGERIWKFVGYEKLNIENKEYKNCAKFIISDELGETTKLWFKKGIGMVRKEYPTGRIEWLIDFKIPKNSGYIN